MGANSYVCRSYRGKTGRGGEAFWVNDQENGRFRETINNRYQFPPENSKENLNIAFDNIMKEINNFYNE